MHVRILTNDLQFGGIIAPGVGMGWQLPLLLALLFAVYNVLCFAHWLSRCARGRL